MYKKLKRFLAKFFKGESLVKIKYAPAEWDAQYRRGNWGYLLNQHENVSLVVNALRFISDSSESTIKVLDVGCGNGALARHLQGEMYEYFGTDISNEALQNAQQVAPKGRYFQSSMDETPNLSEKFDVIVFCEVLIYGDYEKVIENYKQYLKEDGYLLISLYDVWRTKIIWYRIKRRLNVINYVYVKNMTRNVAWNVCLAKCK